MGIGYGLDETYPVHPFHNRLSFEISEKISYYFMIFRFHLLRNSFGPDISMVVITDFSRSSRAPFSSSDIQQNLWVDGNSPVCEQGMTNMLSLLTLSLTSRTFSSSHNIHTLINYIFFSHMTCLFPPIQFPSDQDNKAYYQRLNFLLLWHL